MAPLGKEPAGNHTAMAYRSRRAGVRTDPAGALRRAHYLHSDKAAKPRFQSPAANRNCPDSQGNWGGGTGTPSPNRDRTERTIRSRCRRLRDDDARRDPSRDGPNHGYSRHWANGRASCASRCCRVVEVRRKPVQTAGIHARNRVSCPGCYWEERRTWEAQEPTNPHGSWDRHGPKTPPEVPTKSHRAKRKNRRASLRSRRATRLAAHQPPLQTRRPSPRPQRHAS